MRGGRSTGCNWEACADHLAAGSTRKGKFISVDAELCLAAQPGGVSRKCRRRRMAGEREPPSSFQKLAIAECRIRKGIAKREVGSVAHVQRAVQRLLRMEHSPISDCRVQSSRISDCGVQRRLTNSRAGLLQILVYAIQIWTLANEKKNGCCQSASFCTRRRQVPTPRLEPGWREGPEGAYQIHQMLREPVLQSRS